MSVYGNAIMLGGGGEQFRIIPRLCETNGTYDALNEGAGGYNPVTVNVSGSGIVVYAYTSPPTSLIGENGDYYMELSDAAYSPAFANDPANNANSASGGWEFKANAAINILGVRAYVRSSMTGKTIQFGTSSGTVLKTVTVDLAANQWTEVLFDEPVTLTAGTNYIVLLTANSGTLKYQTNPALTTDKLTYVRGRYGTFPGSQESGTAYSVDVLYESGASEPPYPIKKEYYKTGGAWTEVV